MSDNAEKFIKKITFTDGTVYYLYDVNAPRISDLNNYLPLAGGTITGNLKIDQALQAGSLKIDSIVYQSTTTDNVLIQAADGTIKKRSVDNLLEDIGGCSYSMDGTTGTLTFKVGKQ